MSSKAALLIDRDVYPNTSSAASGADRIGLLNLAVLWVRCFHWEGVDIANALSEVDTSVFILELGRS